jgi:beta-lactamase regulating signal transducer with metallopeptidase domain/membrane-associated protease RseP (regulator of RpoE activity)
MNGTWPSFAGWLLHSMVGGGLLLLLAVPLLGACRQPARRQRVGELALVAALFVPLLALAPSWITFPLPRTESAAAIGTSLEPLPGPFDFPSHSSQDSGVLAADSRESVWPQERNSDDFAAPGRVQAQPAFSTPEVDLGSTGPAASAASPQVAPAESRGVNSSAECVNLDRWAFFIGLFYIVASLLLLVRWLLGHWILWRLLRAATPAPQALANLFTAMARGQRRRPRLLVSQRLRVPLSCGIFRPCVVIPANFLEPKAARTLRWVFAHELTHLQRGDAWSCVLFALGQLWYFGLPWFWWLRRQVRLCQEYIADAAAAEQTADPEDYAQFLIRLTQAPAVPLGAQGVLGNSSDLFRRVTMLLQSPIRVEKTCPRWWSLAAASGLLGLALFVSGIGVRAEAATGSRAKQAVAFLGDQELHAKGDKQENELEPGSGNLPGKKHQEIEKESAQPVPAASSDQAEERPLPLYELRSEPDGSRARLELWRPSGGRLGVAAQKPSPALADQLNLPKGQGLVIEDVLPDSAAAKAGLKKHDILLEFNGKPVPNEVADFVRMLNEVKANTPVDAVVLRKGKKETIRGISMPEGRSMQPFQLQVAPGGPRIPVLPGLRAPHNWMPPNIQLPNIQPPGFGPPGERGVFTTMFRTKDSFTTRYQEGSLIITVTGSVTDGKSKVKEIQIQDGGTSESYESVDKVPEQYREKVKNLIDMAEKNNLKIEVGKVNTNEAEKKANNWVIRLNYARAPDVAKAILYLHRNPYSAGNLQPIGLSITTDDASNSLFVTCPAGMYKDIKQLAEALDEAARRWSHWLSRQGPGF